MDINRKKIFEFTRQFNSLSSSVLPNPGKTFRPGEPTNLAADEIQNFQK
jgi:hypothetical protein